MHTNIAARTLARRCRAPLAIALALAGSMAQADTATLCVANDGQLATALGIARTTPLAIQLVQGTYHLDQTVWNAKLAPATYTRFAAGSSLLGGFSNGTCTARDIGPGNTVVTDTTVQPNDRLHVVGDATIEGVTFALPNGLSIVADGNETEPVPPGSRVLLRRNVFTQTVDTLPLYVYWNEEASAGGSVRLVDNLLHDNNSTDVFAQAAAITVQVAAGKPTVELINNTVVDNTGTLAGFGLHTSLTVPVRAYNNIFYGNAAKDFVVAAGTDIKLVDNVIATHTWPGTAQDTGTTTADPKLDANFRPIEAPASYVINSGTASVAGGLPATDLPGRVRQVGSAPDRGAFESTINDLPILTVTTTADSGIGSLRSAIASANANGPTLILFDLGSAAGCPYTIAPATPLPQITQSITFAGYSQVGSSKNTLAFGFDGVLCVILDGSPHALADGLYVSAGAADGTQVSIDGLAFSGFSHGAVSLYGGSGHALTGAKIGGNTGGQALDPSGNGVIIGPGVHDVTIGGGGFGSDDAARNLIGSATGLGIVVDGASGMLPAGHDNTISGNFIGAGYNANTSQFVDRGNGGAGVTLAGPGNSVHDNIILFNGGYGVNLTNSSATANSIADNFIGTFGANGGGIVVQNSAHDNQLVENDVRFNNGTGVRVVNGQGNTVSRGYYYSNNGLGIDLAGAGVTANDNDTDPQPAGYANRGLNFPLLDQAVGGHVHGRISGSLLTAPGSYTITVYGSTTCEDNGYGEGEFPIGTIQAQTGGLGINGQFLAPFTLDFYFPLALGTSGTRSMTATATDAAGNTSEFSACLPYVDDTLFADDFD